MRIRSAVIALLLTACWGGTDMPTRTMTAMQQEGYGGWIVVATRSGSMGGELISVEPTELRMLVERRMFRVPLSDIVTADLYLYTPETFGTWGALGVVSTLSHGVLLVITAPVWWIASSIVNHVEAQHMICSYPGEEWSAFARWARFPQGMPTELRPSDLVDQVRLP
jgi:hypothetical protein